MTKTKKIEYASIDLVTTYAVVIDGQVEFRQKIEYFTIENFDVPEVVDNEKKLDQYLSERLYKSDCDIASVRSVYVHDWEEV